jgi:hypothetical protein
LVEHDRSVRGNLLNPYANTNGQTDCYAHTNSNANSQPPRSNKPYGYRSVI